MPGEAGGASSGSDATAEPQALISTSRAQFLQMLTGIISPESIIVEGGSTVPETLLSMLNQSNQTLEFLFPLSENRCNCSSLSPVRIERLLRVGTTAGLL